MQKSQAHNHNVFLLLSNLQLGIPKIHFLAGAFFDVKNLLLCFFPDSGNREDGTGSFSTASRPKASPKKMQSLRP
jgi:hypothetical protein